jgi:hypothetical protein
MFMMMCARAPATGWGWRQAGKHAHFAALYRVANGVTAEARLLGRVFPHTSRPRLLCAQRESFTGIIELPVSEAAAQPVSADCHQQHHLSQPAASASIAYPNQHVPPTETWNAPKETLAQRSSLCMCVYVCVCMHGVRSTTAVSLPLEQPACRQPIINARAGPLLLLPCCPA